MLAPTHENVPGNVFKWQKRQLGQSGPKINETLFYNICLLVSYECGFKSVGECHGFPSKTPCV